MQRCRADLIDQRRTAINLQIDILERIREDLRQDLLDDISAYTEWDAGDLRVMAPRIRRVLDTKYRLLNATRREILCLRMDTHAVPIEESRNAPSNGSEDLADFMRTLREELAPDKAEGRIASF